ncbi:MAG: hypothetical protein AAGH45_01060 [Pseudomonadota bacterium]
MNFPRMLPRKYDGIEGLNPPSVDDFKKLKSVLERLADDQSFPAKKPADRMKMVLDHLDLPAMQKSKLFRIWQSRGTSARRIITQTECKSFLKSIKDTGLMEFGQPLGYFAMDPHMFPLAFARRMGRPNGDLAAGTHEVYEMYSLDTSAVLSEMGRYYLTKGALEVKADDNGIVHVRMFQRSGAAPGDTVDEVYFGNMFVQDDTGYTVMFRDKAMEAVFESAVVGGQSEAGETDRTNGKSSGKSLTTKSRGNKPNAIRLFGGSKNEDKKQKPETSDTPDTVKFTESRKNMAVMVLNGISRGEDGLYDKFTGGQLGRGLNGSTSVLSAPCVLYRVSNRRVIDVARKINAQHQGNVNSVVRSVLKTNGADITPAVKAQVMREFAGQEEIMYGIDPQFASVMSDLGVPIPRPDAEDQAGPEIYIANE